jgi:hypothetical protein
MDLARTSHILGRNDHRSDDWGRRLSADRGTGNLASDCVSGRSRRGLSLNAAARLSEASFEFFAQPRTVQVPADQHQPVAHRRRPSGFVQSKSFADEVKYVAPIALIDPQHALGAKELFGSSSRKYWNRSAAKGRSASNESASNPSLDRFRPGTSSRSRCRQAGHGRAGEQTRAARACGFRLSAVGILGVNRRDHRRCRHCD